MEHWILSAAIWATGSLFLFAALFLREDEDAKIQSWLEQQWNAAAQFGEAAISKSVDYLHRIAGLTQTVLTWAYGSTLWSVKCLCAAYAYSGLALVAVTWVERAPPDLGTLAVMLVLFVPVAALAHNKPRLAGCLALVSFVVTSLPARRDARLLFLPAILVLSVASDLLFIALARWLMMTIGRWKSASAIALTTLSVNSLVLFILVVGPLFYPSFHLHTPLDPRISALPPAASMVDRSAHVFAASNALSGVTISMFTIVAVVMLAHRLVWPALLRPFYAIWNRKLLQQKKLLFMIGLTLVGTRVPNLKDWVLRIMK